MPPNTGIIVSRYSAEVRHSPGADGVVGRPPPPPPIGGTRMKEILTLLILLLQVIKALLDYLNR